MVVCRYFLQGYCKFGDHCRYQHFQDNRNPNPAAGYRSHSRSWASPTHGKAGRAGSPVGGYNPTQGGQPGLLSPLDLAAAIKDDVVTMEEGVQWPLTCYSPSKDFGSFPGFHDMSMEEVRYEAYQAQASGTFDQYMKKIENLIQATRMKWGMLKNPTGQVMSVIEKMASGQGVVGESPSVGLPSFSFTAALSTSLQHQHQHQSGFSLSGNTAFAAPQSAGNIFSSASAAPSAASASSFTFTLAPQPAMGGASPPPPGTPPNAFGASHTFGQSGSGLWFGSSGAPPGMQQPMTAGLFVGQSQASGEKQGSVFGVAHNQTAGSIFASSSAGFGAGAFQPKPLLAPPPACTSPGIYTPLAHLTEEEKKEFTAVTFTLGCVPLRPPPSELCV